MLKLQYFVHLMQRANSLEKTLMLRKIEGRRRKEQQKMRWFGWYHRVNGHEFEQSLEDSEGQGSLVYCGPWGHKESGTTERFHLIVKGVPRSVSVPKGRVSICT